MRPLLLISTALALNGCANSGGIQFDPPPELHPILVPDVTSGQGIWHSPEPGLFLKFGEGEAKPIDSDMILWCLEGQDLELVFQYIRDQKAKCESK